MELRYDAEGAAMAFLRAQAETRDFITRATPDPLPASMNHHGHSWIEVAIDWLDQPIATYEMRSGVKCSKVTLNALAELEAHSIAAVNNATTEAALRDLLADVLNLASGSVTTRPSVKAARAWLAQKDGA